MGEVMTIGCAEDIDANAAVQVLAPINSQVGGVTVPEGTDRLKLPAVEGMELRALRWTHETAGGTGGYFVLKGKGADRKHHFGKNKLVGDHLVGEILYPPGKFPLPAGQEITLTCGIAGSGTEQHCILMDIWNPALAAVPKLMGETPKETFRYGKKTGTLVAATISGMGNVLQSLEDSMAEFPTDKDSRYALTRMSPYPSGAGYSVLGLMHPNGQFCRLFPAIMAAAVTGRDYDIGWLFNGDSPPKAVGAGVGTTTTEMTLELAKIS